MINREPYNIVIDNNSDIQKAPPPIATKYRSLQEAIDYQYNFDIPEVITEAWHMTHNNKLTILIAIIVMAILSYAVSFLGQMLTTLTVELPTLTWLIYIVSSVLSTIFVIGVIFIALKISNKEAVNMNSDFKIFSKYWVSMFCITLLMLVFIAIGFVFLILPGIYLAIGYTLAYWILLVHPEAAYWDILEASRKIVNRHWFKFFFLNIILGIIIFISIIPLGIGLIWTLPLCSFVYAIIFKKIFVKPPPTLQ